MGGKPCSEGCGKLLGRSPPNPPKGNSCEVLSERQIKSHGCILPNNSGQEPKNKYDMTAKPVGTGAFGTVRIAKNKQTGLANAIKTIKKSAIPNMDAFLNEVEINTSMDHPSIVRLYETFEDSQQVYLVMEVCTGGELFDTIIEQGFFGEPDAAAVIKQVLAAVYYMHLQGIAHRDLKPENFLLQDKGKAVRENVVKVIDFGIAGRFQHKASPKGSDVPSFKTMAGTAYYVAPEVLTGKYSEKCDVWSIGVILYILLSGSPPFAGDSDEDILRAVKKGAISFDLEEFAQASKEVKELILTMCTRSPVQRPSAGEVLNSSWPQLQSTKTKCPADSGIVLKKLKAFSSVSRFKKAALAMIAHRLDDHAIVKLRDTFTSLDKNGDGMLTFSEIKDACAAAGLGDSADVKKLFQQLDLDGSGSIGYTEFLAGMIDQKNYLKEELCWEAFRTFDRDGSGQIDMSELQQILRDNPANIGEDFKETDIAQVFREADKDGDGKISFAEFKTMLQGST